MDYYKIRFKGSVERDLRKIDKQHIAQILKVVEFLKQDPFPIQSTKLIGTRSSYRMRSGDYRIIYRVDILQRIVTVEYIRHRREVYRKI